MAKGRGNPNEGRNMAEILMDKKTWPLHFFIVVLISVAGCVYLGVKAHYEVPPLCDYTDAKGKVLITSKQINHGEEVFHLRGLMSYGSFLGDGAERGPDFTAETVHIMTVRMNEFYAKKMEGKVGQYEEDAIASRVRRELHLNTYNEKKDTIQLNAAQIYGLGFVVKHYNRMFTDADYEHLYQLNWITDENDLHDLATFFFWGAWACTAARPAEDHSEGFEDFSYTHNWPYDPAAGNTPTSGIMFWSIIAIFALFIGIGIVLYVYGQMRAMKSDPFQSGNGKHFLTTHDLENDVVRPTQRATYKFFVFAVVVFMLQVLCGIMSATDFVRPFGINVGEYLPFPVMRSFHTILQIYWFFMCWVGYTLFFLPRLNKVPYMQEFLINFLFLLCLIVGAGAIVGIYLGQTGVLTGEDAYWLGSQGWEFMELGRLFQLIMLGAFVLWIFIIYRGVAPWISAKNLWSVPAWLFYGSGVMVMFLFFGLAVTPKANFIVSDFWRWMVVHMWVEVTFEVFTTVIMGYLIVEMGLVTRKMTERVVFLAVMMFFVTAINGVAHNFYWIAKPTGVIALGSVFSTLQVLPLLLLTLDAWRMQQKKNKAEANVKAGKQNIVMNEVFRYVLAVNFWNIFGAGMFGSLINLPIVNYFEHATYLTGNHAHAAMFGVKGNVALGGMMFCLQHMIKKENWDPKMMKTIFWSLNLGIALMMFLDLFPAGLYQLTITLSQGFWACRSATVIGGSVFRTLTYFRSFGGAVFLFGGVFPLVGFVVSNMFSMRPESKTIKEDTMWSLTRDINEEKEEKED